jgi:hypothetical protein
MPSSEQGATLDASHSDGWFTIARDDDGRRSFLDACFGG